VSFSVKSVFHFPVTLSNSVCDELPLYNTTKLLRRLRNILISFQPTFGLFVDVALSGTSSCLHVYFNIAFNVMLPSVTSETDICSWGSPDKFLCAFLLPAYLQRHTHACTHTHTRTLSSRKWNHACWLKHTIVSEVTTTSKFSFLFFNLRFLLGNYTHSFTILTVVGLKPTTTRHQQAIYICTQTQSPIVGRQGGKSITASTQGFIFIIPVNPFCTSGSHGINKGRHNTYAMSSTEGR
jgi:hypothetical protein